MPDEPNELGATPATESIASVPPHPKSPSCSSGSSSRPDSFFSAASCSTNPGPSSPALDRPNGSKFAQFAQKFLCSRPECPCGRPRGKLGRFAALHLSLTFAQNPFPQNDRKAGHHSGNLHCWSF